MNVLREFIKDEIILFKKSIAAGEKFENSKLHFIKARNAFIELHSLTYSCQATLQEMIDEFMKDHQK